MRLLSFTTMTNQVVKPLKECASVLPPGKVKIAHLQGDYKDASDALQANDSDAVCRAIWDAKPFRPDGIVDGKTLLRSCNNTIPRCRS